MRLILGGYGRLTMEFRILGPVEAIIGGDPVGINAPRQGIVLTTLLLEANQVVTVSRLVDAMWDEDPPATAKGQVQIAVSALRRMLAVRGDGGVIVTRSPGYLIRVPDDALDLKRFESLAADGSAAADDDRLEEAVRKLRGALALWRGPAAEGVESKVVQAAAVRLNESRLALWEKCIDLELRLGRHHALIGELSELVARYPLRERLRAQLMLALYRSGRQAEALEAFRDARAVLSEELGLEPGEELQDLERAILVSDPALGLPRRPAKLASNSTNELSAPRQLPATIADFTGREDVLARICQSLSPAADERRRHVPLVILTGRGGVGKTTLAIRAAHLVADSFPDGQLYAEFNAGEGQPRSPLGVLDGFVRSLGVDQAALRGGLEERAALYRSLVAKRRILIVLDDAISLEQVKPLMPGSPSCAMLVTSRRRFSGLEGAHQFEIDELTQQPAMELVARLIGADRASSDQASMRRLVALCGGLPLTLRIAAAKLRARPYWSVGHLVNRLEDETRRLDELVLDGVSISSTLELSYKSLDDSGRTLLRRLSLLGTVTFASWVCAPLLGIEPEAAETVLEDLVESWLVETRVTGNSSVRFQLHDLVRIYATERFVHEEPPGARAVLLRRLLGCWLALAAEAYRRVYGGDYGLVHGSAEQWRLPPATVDAILPDPMRWFECERPALAGAILQACQAGLDELAWDLAITAVAVFEAGSYVDDWQETHQTALTAVREAANQRGEAALLCSLGNLALTARLDDARVDFERSLRLFERLGDVHGHALALNGLATVDRLHGRYNAARSRYRQALLGFQRAGDLISEAHVLNEMAQIHMDQREYGLAETLLSKALVVCRKVNARRVTAQAEHRMAELHLLRGSPHRAAELFRSALRLSSENGDIVGQAYALLGLGTVSWRQGDPGQAEERLRAAADLGDRCSDYMLRGRILLSLAELYMAGDRTESATVTSVQALAMLSHLGSATVWQGRAMELIGRLHERAGRTDAAVHAWLTALGMTDNTMSALTDKLRESLARHLPEPGSQGDAA